MKKDTLNILPTWKKSREEIWAEKFECLEDVESPKINITFFNQKLFKYSVAAALVIMMMFTTTAYLFTESITASRGQHVTAYLPDGSKIELNAESSISFKPYWWKLSRVVKMTGEVYYEVAKGSKFTVHSSQGSVSVLGTSFNVYDRKDVFKVTCLTGKVAVESHQQSIQLTKGMQGLWNGTKLIRTESDNSLQQVAWMDGNFSFDAAPLSNVLAEVERQYDVEIIAPANIDYLYSGNFSKTNSPQEVLEIIEKPFGIKLSIAN